MNGFVSFVSAGPGDPELLTVRGAARLREADVVLYDDLASGSILDLVRPEANLVAVGKRAGRPSAKQHHVNRLLVDFAATGARVVRLKSGDAGIFGRLEEEIETLQTAGVAYEIVPGVTAGCVAAAHAGIPLTRRNTSRRVQFVTGADISGQLPDDLNWAALADPEATTVVYMGRRTWPALLAQLLAHGLPPDTPALLAESLGKADQRLIHSTISRLSAELGQPQGATIATVILFGPLAGSSDGA